MQPPYYFRRISEQKKQPGQRLPIFRWNRIGISAIIMLLTLSEAWARDSQTYLPANSVDAVALVGYPPAVDSNALREQMTVVLWLQKTRTPAQIEFVKKPLNLERFVPILNESLLEVDGSELKQLLDSVISEVRAEYDALKGKFNLPRPFEINDAVNPVGEARAVAAYPSGHSIRAIVYARLLGEIFPEHRKALIDLGLQIGYGRVIAGVHFPIDVIAGQKLGSAYAEIIVSQQSFLDAIALIRSGQ